MEDSCIVDFNFYVGTHSGILKGLKFTDKKLLYQNYIKNDQEKKQKVVSLSWLESNNEEEIRMYCSNWTTRVFNPKENYFVSSRNLKSPDSSPMVSGFSMFDTTVGASKSGRVKIFKMDPVIISTIPEGPLSDRQLKSTLDSMKQNPMETNSIACGGCENDLSIWDLNNPQKEIFRAKNVKLDMLQLRVPVHISDLVFLRGSTIATCTRYHEVRLYDTRAQRRPVVDFSWEDSPFSRIVSVPDSENQVIVGTAHGRMALFDLRKTKPDKHVAAYKYFEGSVQDIVHHPTLPLIFSVSLDRFLRIHHARTKEVLYKEFLKSRLSRLLLGNIKEDDLPFQLKTSEKSLCIPPRKKLKV